MNDTIEGFAARLLAANKESKKKSKDAEIAKLRALVKGLLEAATVDCAECNYDCGCDRGNCIIHEAAKYIEESEDENG